MALDTNLGWSDGDDLRVLVAGAVPVSVFAISQIQSDMNYLGSVSQSFVYSVLDLLDQYDAAKEVLITLNTTSEGKTLVKADVLEWEVGGTTITYSPQSELARIRGELALYFASSPAFGGSDNHSALYRS